MKNKELKKKKKEIEIHGGSDARNYVISVKTRKDLIKRARKLGLNISKTLHNLLESTVEELEDDKASIDDISW